MTSAVGVVRVHENPAGATFRVTIPTQRISGTYSLVFGQDTLGNSVKDTALNKATDYWVE